MYPQYMCILLYVKLIWCSGILYIYCQLAGVVVLDITMICIYYIYVFGYKTVFFCILFALCDYTCDSLKVVPWYSNTLDC